MTRDDLFNLRPDMPDPLIKTKAKEKWDSLAKPIDGLGDFEDMICRIAGMTRTEVPDLKDKGLIIMCADNGIVSEGVTQTGREVTYEVASLMGHGKSSVGRMLADYPVTVYTVDIGIDSDDTPEGVIRRKVAKGTADFLYEPAMTPDEVIRAIETGMECVRDLYDKGIRIIATGEMGIGNTTTSSALMSVFTGLDVKECTGRGAGLSDEGLLRKIEVINRGIEKHFPDRSKRDFTSKEDAFDALCRLGGLDIAGLAGVFIGGAVCKVPIVIDGFISMIAALAAERLVPGCREYMIASHMGREKGMKIPAGELGLKPVLCADMALGEGTGAVMLFPLLDMVMSLYESGMNFSDTPIGEYKRFEKK